MTQEPCRPCRNLLPEPAWIPEDRNPITGLKRLGQFAGTTHKASLVRWGSYFSHAEKLALYSEDWGDACGCHSTEDWLARPTTRRSAGSLLDRTLGADHVTYLAGDLLPKTDRMTMAHSVEARRRSSTRTWVEWTARLPENFKLRGSNTKWLLKKAFWDRLPGEILERGKQGFSVPVGAWLQSELSAWSRRLITGNETFGQLFNRQVVEDDFRLNQSSRGNHGKKLWTLLLLISLAGRWTLKIVFFIDHLRPDGTQRFLVQLVSGLGERGYLQTIICLNDTWDEQVVHELRQSGAEVKIIGKKALLLGTGMYNLYAWLKQENFDRAVTLLFYSDVLGRFLAHLAQIPLIITSIRRRNTNYSWLQRLLVRSTVRWADIVVLNSARFIEFAVQEEGVDEQKIAVIPNGTDVIRFSSGINPLQVKSGLGLPENAFVFGSVGRLEPQKGYDLLLSAFSKLNGEDIHLVLVGDGSQRDALCRQAKDLGVGERVRLTSYRNDIPDLLGTFDVYVQPSRFEGMPNALLEAMAAGKPVIASAVDGHLDLVKDGQNGWLVPVESEANLTIALEEAPL